MVGRGITKVSLLNEHLYLLLNDSRTCSNGEVESTSRKRKPDTMSDVCFHSFQSISLLSICILDKNLTPLCTYQFVLEIT